MTTATGNISKPESVKNSGLLPGALAGAVIGSVLNLIVYFVATGVLNIVLQAPNPQTQELMPIAFPFVVVATTLPAFAAALLVWLLGRFTPRPWTIFYVISAVFLLLSFGGPAGLPIELGGILALNLMHVIAAAAIVGGLTWRARA
jgi:hypothetical protein